jgi:hypothetical protein
MELVARTSPLPRRVAMMAALAALLITSAFAGAAAAPAQAKKKAKAPVITKVSPMDAAIGEVLTIKGRYFLRGKKKNTVVFKRPGARAVFVKADLGTTKLLRVTLPAELQKVFQTKNNIPVATRFQLRVLTTRLGKKYTSNKRSPVVSAPRPPKPPQSAADGDCDGDGVKNSATSDDDNDLLPDTLEAQLNTDPCKADTDGDKVEDGYEYESALNLNDDEFQEPNANLFYPAKLPYPNPLFAGDADIDFDGDSLTLSEEQALWRYTWNVSHSDARTLTPLSYSDGEQYSRSTRVAGRRQPTLPAAGYDKQAAFVTWTATPTVGYRTVMLQDPWFHPGAEWTSFGLFDLNRDGLEADEELTYFDRDFVERVWQWRAQTGLTSIHVPYQPGSLSDDERDEDADGLSNYDELHGRMQPGYWNSCYTDEPPFHVAYQGTSAVDADSDGDGVLDGADDQDHDDVPNVMELSRIAASGEYGHIGGAECTKAKAPAPALGPAAYGRVNPFNPCLPYGASRTCPRYSYAVYPDGWYALN